MARKISLPENQRFHISTGPASLFERVRFKMSGPRTLSMSGHAKKKENVSPEVLAEVLSFDSSKWELVQASASIDTGKFVKTAWRRKFDQDWWWIVIGYHNTVMTIFKQRSQGKTGLDSTITTSGEVYDLVERVNRELMEAESKPNNDTVGV